MGAHETLEGTLAAVETDAIRLHAAALVNRFHHGTGLDPDGSEPMGRADWVQWEGEAYAVLREIVRG